jgi:hypothetical protein
VPGEGAGSPQASSDGRNIMATHNFQQMGHFSVFDLDADTTEPIFQYQSSLLVFDQNTPFSAVG